MKLAENNVNKLYQSETAQKNYVTTRKLCGHPTAFTPELSNIIK
ncbi:hypothetical protein UM590_01385 [Staphylococcus aureus]|nr:hypothetical protein UM590_01385 [Staphylococcus aureus]